MPQSEGNKNKPGPLVNAYKSAPENERESALGNELAKIRQEHIESQVNPQSMTEEMSMKPSNPTPLRDLPGVKAAREIFNEGVKSGRIHINYLNPANRHKGPEVEQQSTDPHSKTE